MWHCTHLGVREPFAHRRLGPVLAPPRFHPRIPAAAEVAQTGRSSCNISFFLSLQACSILYKTRLPVLLVFNKVDVTPHDFALEWMGDFEVFQVGAC